MLRCRGLPQTGVQQFATMMDMVERKRYPKSLRTADDILTKFPNHGETITVKGLIRYYMNQPAEAYKLVRKGLKLDLASPISWYILATIYRSDRATYIAIQCFKIALTLSPNNERILRDFAPNLIQIRDYDEYFNVRKKLFDIRPDIRGNWFALAIAAHLNGYYDFSLSLLTQVESSCLEDENNMEKWEINHEVSQIIIYKIFLQKDSGDLQGALETLRNSRNKVLDKLLLKENEAELLITLGKLKEAEDLYKELIGINSENVDYHKGLIKALSCDLKNLVDEDRIRLNLLYCELAQLNPKSAVIKQFKQLYFSSEEEFESNFSSYVEPLIYKGVPSLWKSVVFLYDYPNRIHSIEKIILGFEKKMMDTTFTSSNGAVRDPTAIIWVYYFLSQHYNKLKNFESAHKYIDLAIEHTPTVIDFYLGKARIFKNQKDFLKASELVENARIFDLNDRYLNSKAVKYALRADQIEMAKEKLSIFTKVDNSAYNNAFVIQVIWFEVEMGESYERQEEYALALKYYKHACDHYSEFEEDQFDFHNYCAKKLNFKTYINMLRFEDKLYIQPYYVRAARGLIRVYLQLAKDRENPLPPSEQKILLEKYKKSHKNALNLQKAGKKPWNGKYDPDPVGEILRSTTKPLEKAYYYAKILSNAKDFDTQILIVTVFLDFDKPMMALKALKNAVKMKGSSDENVEKAIIYFKQVWETKKANHHLIVNKIIQEHFDKF